VEARFRVEADPARARAGEGPGELVDGLHHQVHVDGGLDAPFAQRLAHQRPDRQVGDVVVVHHVEMDDVRAGGEHGLDLLPEAGEIGGKDGRGDEWGWHGHSLL
jgi:hypothetical protein